MYTEHFFKGVNEEDLIKTIEGDVGRLIIAFTWDKSPQGHKYWANIYHRNYLLELDKLKDILEAYREYKGEKKINLEDLV